MSEETRRSRATEAFFGRRKGKALRERQADVMEHLLPALRLDPKTPPVAGLEHFQQKCAAALRPEMRQDKGPEHFRDSEKSENALAGLFPVPVERIRLEIGFGGGEHLVHRAREEPSTGFIGVEPFVNSMAKLLASVRDLELKNIRVYDDDATVLLDWLPEASVDRIDLLYPDPWPKRKHWKRRFVSQVNLERFHRVLKPGGLFCFASDIDTYVNWTLLHCRRHGGFAWTARNAADWLTPFAGWPGTRYEAKARREGRSSAYLTFRRV